MRATLHVPYSDNRAAQLSWRLGAPPGPALASLRVPVAGGWLDLRLLGGSHHVVLSVDGVSCSEVVACGGGAPGLPPAAIRSLPGLRYRFCSRLSCLPPRRLAAGVDRLVARLDDHPGGLVGHFPGSAHAVTALLAEATGPVVRWRTWHTYPQTGELVSTLTAVDRR